MKIYTKTGDTGSTSLYGGERRIKADQRIESYGSVDELQAALGVALAELANIQEGWVQEIARAVTEIQADTFVMCAELARTGKPRPGQRLPELPQEAVERLEREIDTYDAQLPQLRNFIMQGGSKPGASFHLARAVCRRAERQVVLLAQTEEVRPIVLGYLNRLSDLLFVYARFINMHLEVPEVAWLQD
jgi:cob(I)alamin adenosyltransferase